MVYNIEEVKKKIIAPITEEYKINSLSLFGSYARGEATEDSDLDFVMDKGELRSLQYITFADKLEEVLNCPVDLISYDSPNKKVLNSIKKDEVLIYEK